MRRYSHCVGELAPVKGPANVSETDYLINQVRSFLDQANLDNEQMANVSALMDKFCVHDLQDGNYPISQAIDIDKYNAKSERCQAIDDAMDAMFLVLKRAAFNRSEPLDFSTIQWHPQANDTKNFYNLTDLVNTSWIKAGVTLDDTCRITDSVKEYAEMRRNRYSVQDRNQQPVGVLRSLMEFLDSYLNGLLGVQKRMLLDTMTRFEMLQQSIGNQLGNLRQGIGKGYEVTRKRVRSLVAPRSQQANSNPTMKSLNATSSVVGAQLNATTPTAKVATTTTPSAKVSQFSTNPATTATTSTTTSAPKLNFPSVNANSNNKNLTNY